MNYFLILYRLKTCTSVKKYPSYDDAEHALEKILAAPGNDHTGTVLCTTGPCEVSVGDTLAADGTDSFDSGYLDS